MRNRVRRCAEAVAYARRCPVARVYEIWASRCVICNVAPWMLERYSWLGRMQVGHLVPGDPSAGFEPMCRKCNRFLGARALSARTGAEVLRRSRAYWIRMRMREEAWMHMAVDERGYGTGGADETPGRQRVLDRFEEEKRERREEREGAGGRADPRGDGLPAERADGGVVLEDAAQERNPEG
jgi:hypothetical protein